MASGCGLLPNLPLDLARDPTCSIFAFDWHFDSEKSEWGWLDSRAFLGYPENLELDFFQKKGEQTAEAVVIR